MQYPDLEEISRETGIATSILTNVFEEEHSFYKAIKNENSFEKRQVLYEKVYTTIPTFFPEAVDHFARLVTVKKKVVKQFRKEIEGKSLLDIGSGIGAFLYALRLSDVKTTALFGLDVKAAEYPKDDIAAKDINFFQQNILDFNLERTFDVLMMDNVYEHIAPSDQVYFFKSLTSALHHGSKLIMILPHRMFGPTDFTRILDNSHSGNTLAQCVHLNESTFAEVIADLRSHGFTHFQTTIPFIAFQKIRTWFPNLRLPASWFVVYEGSFLMKAMRKIRYKNRPLFRMEIVIIAEYQKISRR